MPNDPHAHRQFSDPNGDELRRVGGEVASRLRSRGVQLTGEETAEELVQLLEAIDHFETTVERHVGDLMVDEAIDTDRPPREPDDRRFVLPRRRDGESVGGFVGRIAEATDRAAGRR